ncbi:MAG: DUF4402 domain-containing protein [Syntrophothermus sp.]
MKTLTKFFAIAVMLFISASSFAQVSATANVSGTIVTPIAISKTTDMNFGNVAVSSTAGTVILSTAGSRTKTGGVTLPTTTGTVAEAVFHITGTPTYTYSISLSGTPVTVTSSGNTMTVDNFITNPTPTGTLDGTGAQDIHIGATLNVAGNQAAGSYTSGTPFTVTVNYN